MPTRNREQEMAAENNPQSQRIGFDIGGTFTDFILEDREAGTRGVRSGHETIVTAADNDEIVSRGHDRLGEEGVS